MAKRNKSGGHDEGGGGHDGGGSLRWLLTYADMITLLMAFFIMMYSMSVLNIAKFRQAAISIKSGFGGMTEGQGKSILGSNGQFSVKPSPIEGESVGVPLHIVKKIQRLVQEEDLGKVVKLRKDKRGLVISLTADTVLFDKGQAELTEGTKRVLSGMAATLGEVPNQIQVEGHTCNLPTSTEKYPSNWELSTARATNVIRYLIHEGIASDRLSAAGYADSKPLYPNNCEKNRAQNRRVDIVVIKEEETGEAEVIKK